MSFAQLYPCSKIRYLAVICLIASCAMTTGCDTVRGSNRVKTEEQPVDAFHSVVLDKWYFTTIEQGATPKMFVTADDNIIPVIKPVIKNGVLHLDQLKGISTKNDITVRLLSPDIRSITHVSPSPMTIKIWDTKELTVINKGIGSIRAEGSVHNLDLQVEGSGNNIFKDMVTNRCQVINIGSGITEVYAKEYLNVKNLGIGIIHYYGSPLKIDEDNQGKGWIKEKGAK